MIVKKVCRLCNKEIGKRDNYVRLTDYKQGQFYCEGFYHTICYNKKLSGSKEQLAMKKTALGLLYRANNLMNKAEEQIQ